MLIKLKNGFELSVDDSALDNWELLEILTEIDEGKSTLITKAFPILVGKEQFSKLKEHLRVNGKVSIVAMVDTFQDVMYQLEHGKKS